MIPREFQVFRPECTPRDYKIHINYYGFRSLGAQGLQIRGLHKDSAFLHEYHHFPDFLRNACIPHKKLHSTNSGGACGGSPETL